MFNPRGGGGKRELELSYREIEWYLLFLSRSVFAINHRYKKSEIKTRDVIPVEHQLLFDKRKREIYVYVLGFCERSIKPDNEENYSTGWVISMLIDRVSLFNRLVIIRGPPAL